MTFNFDACMVIAGSLVFVGLALRFLSLRVRNHPGQTRPTKAARQGGDYPEV